MLQNAYLLAKIGADTAENEQHFAEILPKTGNYLRVRTYQTPLSSSAGDVLQLLQPVAGVVVGERAGESEVRVHLDSATRYGAKHSSAPLPRKQATLFFRSVKMRCSVRLSVRFQEFECFADFGISTYLRFLNEVTKFRGRSIKIHQKTTFCDRTIFTRKRRHFASLKLERCRSV